jgi:hypothetical protein
VGDTSQTALDIIKANYNDLPNSRISNVIIVRGTYYGAVIFKYTNLYGKVELFDYNTTGITVYRLYNGTWSERVI